MFSVYGTENGKFVVSRDDDPAQVLQGDLSDLLRLWARLDAFIRDQQPDGMITAAHPLASAADYIDTAEARALAEAQGKRYPDRTLLYALDAGHIPGAHKDGGRWVMPRGRFLEWLAER